MTRLSAFVRIGLATFIAPLAHASAQAAFTLAREVGQLEAPAKNEASGLAASMRTPDLLWIHDDSGGAPVLYGVGTEGALRGKLRLRDVRNEDWEDVAAFVMDGKSWLLVADTGDNDEKRRHVRLHLVEEPSADVLAPDAEHVVRPTATWTMTYDDGPHDCEAIAVDSRERAVYLLTKRDDVPRLYRVAMPPLLRDATLTAAFLDQVPHLAGSGTMGGFLGSLVGNTLARPCAMDFAADGSAALVLTYGAMLWFPRRDGEAWADALARKPIALAPHGLLQAEAACFARDGSAIYVAAEASRTLVRYDRR